MKAIQSYWKCGLISVCFGTLCTAIVLLIHRGLHGEYGFGIQGFRILIFGLLPFSVLFLRSFSQRKLFVCALCIVAVFLSACVVLYYLSSNGLWCAQHPDITRKMCAKLIEFASFAAESNVTSWWLILGDLLAVQRGRVMPMPWEHDIDVCITPEQFPVFEKAIGSRLGYFKPAAIRLSPGHWYLPIDMAKLGLKAREAEGSWEDRHMLLTKTYGDYSVVKYDHHNTMCRMWNG